MTARRDDGKGRGGTEGVQAADLQVLREYHGGADGDERVRAAVMLGLRLAGEAAALDDSAASLPEVAGEALALLAEVGAAGAPVDLRDGAPSPTTVRMVLIATARLRWRLVSVRLEGYLAGRDVTDLERALAEQDLADAADRDLADHLRRTGPDPAGTGPELEGARRRAALLLAALSEDAVDRGPARAGPVPVAEPMVRPSGTDRADYERWVDSGRRAEQEVTARGEQVDDQALVQAVMAAVARASATQTWDDDCQRLTAMVESRLDGAGAGRGGGPGAGRPGGGGVPGGGGTDQVRNVLLPAAHLMLGLVRAMVENGDPSAPSRPEVLEEHVARAEGIIDRIERADGGGGAGAPLRSVAALLHMLAGMTMLLRAHSVDGEEPEAVRRIRERAQEHLRHAPEGMRGDIEDVLALQRWGEQAWPDDPVAAARPDPAADARWESLRDVHREMAEEAGIEVAEVARLVMRAQSTRTLADVDRALERARSVRVGLAAGHPMHGRLLGMTAHLRALRAMITMSAEDSAAAVQAAVHAVEAVGEPDLETVQPLTESLLMSVMTDPRGGARGPAESALSRVLERDGLDGLTRLSAAVGLGAARALRWAGGPSTVLREQARQALGEAEDLLRDTPPTMEVVQLGVALLQHNLGLMALWGDPGAPAAVRRLADHLEPVIRADPSLQARLDAVLAQGGPGGPGGTSGLAGPGGPVGGLPGMPGLSPGAGVLEMLASVRQMSAVFETLTSMTTSGPLAGLLGGQLPQAQTAGPLLDAVRHQLGNPGTAAPMDLQAMMRAAASSIGRDDAGYRANVAAAHGMPPAPAPPTTGDAARRLREALARARALLDGDRRPLAREGRPDPAQLAAATAEVRAALPDAADPALRHEAHDVLGLGLSELYWAGEATLDQLSEATEFLERARATERHELPDLRRVDLLDVQACGYLELGRCGRLAEPLEQALPTVRAALRELGRCVLLEADPRQALALAARADRIVGRVLTACLQAGRRTEAVHMAEAGRGLVLAAVTASGRVGDLLEALGEPDAARAWRTGGAPGLETGLAALSRAPEGMMLLRTPSAQDVSMALLATGLNAIVYLVPPARPDPAPPGLPPRPPAEGFAMVVNPGFTVDVVPLPDVTSHRLPAVDRYLDCLEAALAALGPDAQLPYGFRSSPAGGAWAQALDELGSWAHRAVIGPLLAHLGGSATGPVPQSLPRVALVPLGELAAVPYAAAWTPDPALPGGRRYAVHDLTLSHAASARLLARVVRRRRLPIHERPVFLIDPTGDFPRGELAGDALVARLYPGATVYGLIGKDGPADDERVLAVLPRRDPPAGPVGPAGPAGPASVLHLITHARLPADPTASPVTGTLLQVGLPPDPAPGANPGSGPVEGPAWLSLGRILAQARGADPGGAGGLVICDACVTDLTVSHRDESLTMATAFLAAGATGAIGTRWPVDDDTAAVLAYVLHHHLAAGAAPAEALRSAQLWMIDPHRPPVPGLPPQLDVELSPGRWAEPASWAGYALHGS